MNGSLWVLVAGTVLMLALAGGMAPRPAVPGAAPRGTAGVTASPAVGALARAGTGSLRTGAALATAAQGGWRTFAAKAPPPFTGTSRSPVAGLALAALAGTLGFAAARVSTRRAGARARRAGALRRLSRGEAESDVARASRLPVDALRMVVRLTGSSGWRRQTLPSGNDLRPRRREPLVDAGGMSPSENAFGRSRHRHRPGTSVA